MGYRIEYGDCPVKGAAGRRFPVWAILLGVAVAAALIPGVRSWVWHWILPGDGAVTADALGTLVTELQAGEPLGEAVAVFCREIIAHGS